MSFLIERFIIFLSGILLGENVLLMLPPSGQKYSNISLKKITDITLISCISVGNVIFNVMLGQHNGYKGRNIFG